MNNKTLILIGLCICLLFTLPMVSAAEISADSGLIDNSVIESNLDNVDSDIASSIEENASMESIAVDDGDISQIPAKGEKLAQSNPDNDILSADGSGNTFTDLKILIDNAISSGNPLTLNRSFAFVEGDDDFKNGIVIDSPITIIGDNHIIDANSLARIFVIKSDNVLLNGITFKNGKTTDSSDFGSDGGALYIQGDHATLENCNFINNTAYENGGAIYITGDGCTLSHTVFRDNIAHDDGGAIAWYGQNGIISDLIASGNTADGEKGNPSGGTLLITGNDISMDMLNISNSRLYKDGGDKPLRGGAIFLTGNNCNITNSVFTNCSVDSTVENSSGGAIYVLGNNTNILNCNFTNNSAIEDGGALYIDGENCTLNHTVFIGNVAHNDGGAIEWNGDNGVIYDLTASGNYADCGNGGSKGGTLLISGNNMHLDKLNVSNTYVNGEHYTGTSAVQGGALALSGNYCNITNSVFTNCSVVYYKDDSNASGGALYIWGNHTNIVNCNFTNNTASEDGGAIYIEGKDCTLNNTVFIGNVAHNDGGAIEWNGDNGRVYNLTAIGNYADSAEGYYYGNPSEGSSKGGTLVLSGNNMNLEKLNITNSRVFANHYTGDKPLQGGAVFLTGNNCNISDSIFHNCSVNYNKGKSYGGAMYIIGNNANLSNCNFTKNTAVLGAGAIYIEGSSTFMDNCNVLNNSAKDAAGIWISGKENTINNTNISYNKASGNGGGVYYQGNNNTVSYSNIDHNTANNGSNVYMINNMVGGKLIGCNITNGRASNFGGGVEWLSNSRECLIKDCYFYNDTSAAHGGGVHWYPGTNGQIDNCTFESCHVDKEKNGGAIYAGATGGTQASGTIISNSKFINCTSGSRGVLTWIGNNGLIVNNTFIDCGKSSGSTKYGGVQAIQIQQGNNNQIIGCNFTNCTSTLGGGAIRLQGDGSNLVNNITIADCHFDNCTAQESAGAVYMNYTAKNVKFENNTFTGNHAPNYGALFIDDAATISSFVNNNFTNNSATASDGNGGAARLHANINVVNSTFTANSCNGSGGAIYTSGVINVLGSTFENNTAKSGGAIATENSNLVVDQSTFKYNKAESGSAISATTLSMSNTELLENQAAFDKWENKNYLFADDHLTVSGTFVGKDNLLNGIKANSGTFNNVIYCGVNGGGVGEGTTNTDDVLSANSYNEVHQIVIMEVYDVNGEMVYNVTNYTDEDGDYNFDLSLDGAVVSLVKVYHPEDNYYTGAEYEIVRVQSELNITCENIYVEEVENITFKVTGSNDTPTGNITVLINDTDGNVIFNGTIPLNGSGEANITLSGLNASQYYIYASYNGDNDYLPVNETADFNVSKWNSTVEVVPIPSITYGSLESINITVSSDATTGNFTGNLTINITSEDAIGFENISQIIVLTLDDEGKIIGWTINDMILPIGNYTIDVAYSGNYKYNGNSSKSKFKVVKAVPTVNVNTTDIDYNTTEPVKFNVTGVDGGALPTGNVTVVVTNSSGGVVFNGTVPVEDGLVSVPVLPAGKYNVTATYNGDANYTSVTGKANFTVRAIDSSVSVDVSNITYGDNEIIKFNVTDGATGTVNITVTGVDGVVATFNDVPIANGTVGVNVADLAAGNYSVNVTYSGDNNFNPSSDVANFTVNNAMPTVKVNTTDIDYNTTEPVKFNVTGVDGGALPTGNVTVVVTNSSGGVVFNGTVPVEDGLVSVPVLPAGKYNVTATYNGDANYTSVTGKANFTVRAIDSSVSVDVSNITYGDNEIIKFNVTDGATGTVNITVTGVDGVVATFNDVPIANGTVGVNVADLAAGNYSVNVTYSGDNNFNPSSDVANFTVNNAMPTVKVNTTDIDYNTTEPVKFNVTGVDGGALPTGNVTVVVTNSSGGVVFNGTVPVEDGLVSVPVLPAGKYNVTATYNGDANYTSVTGKANFTVRAIDSSVSVDVSNITYGDNEIIKFNVTDGATGTVNITVTGVDGVVATFNDVPIANGTVGVNVADLAAGNYSVNVTYSGDNNFNPSSDVANFTVNNAMPTVKVNTTDIDYNTTEPVKFNVTGVDGGALPTGNVTVVVTNSSGGVVFNGTVPVEDGLVSVPVLPAGKYNVTATYNGDANYTSVTGKANFTVRAIDSSVSVDVSNITYGDNEIIKFNVTDGATGTVNITVTGVDGVVATFNDVPIANGTVGVNVADLAAGNYSVNVTYSGDNNFNPSSDVANFTVNNAMPTVKVNTTDIDYNTTEPVKFNVTGVDGGALPTGNVTVVVTNSSGGVVFNGTVPVEDGLVSVPVLPAGKYNVTATYNGDANYTSVTGKANFTVRAIDSSVSVDVSNITYGDNEIIKFNVTDGATGTVNITVTGVDGVVATFNDVPIANGTVGVNVADLAAGNYSVNVTYSGDNNFNPSSDVANFTVNNAMPTVKVNTTDIDYNTTEPVKFNVTGVDGGALPTGNVTVVVTNSSGGVVFNGTVPVEDGLVSVPVLPAGKYNVTATYNGDANYTSVTGKANFTVRAIDSSVSVDVSNITYGDNEIIKFNVTDGATGTVNITVTGVDGVVATFNDVPIANGTVGVNVADLAAGNYSVNVTYSGDNNFNPSSDVANFTVNNAMPTVKVNTTDIDYNTTEPVKFNVTGVDGGALPTGNVTVVVTNSSGGVVFNGTVPVEDGLVSVPVLPAGKYNVTATYNGDANYTSVTGKANFTVRAIDSSVSVDVSNITYGDNEIIKFNVTDGATGTVNITVTGVDGVVATFNDVPIANGTVGVNVADLAAGNYSVNVTYSGDNNFNPSSDVANFTVNNAMPTVKVNTTDIDYNTTEPVKFNVTGVDGGALPTGNVTVVVTNSSGGVVFNGTVPVEDGLVSVPVLPAGKYNVTATYNGDANYTSVTGKANFTVRAIDSSVSVDVSNITYGDNEIIKFNVTDGATGTVNITVTGVDGVVATFNDVPIANGTVGVNVADLAAGNYSVNVTYSGDNNFNPSSDVANFTVNNAMPTVKVNTTDIDYNTTEPVKFNVTGVDGGALPTGNVTVVVTNSSGGVVFNGTVPVEDGLVSVPVLPAGKYNVTATYNGDANYTSVTGKANFTVRAIDSSVSVDVSNITYGDNEIIKFNVTDGATGTVNITVTGVDGVVATFNDVPIANGTVGVNVADLAAGNYSVNVTYSGDNNFNPSSDVANFTVNNAMPTVKVNTTDIDYNTTEPVKFNVTGVDGGALPTGNVTVVVTNSSGGVVFNGTVPVEDGLVSVPVLPAGKYNVTATYNGDANYTSVTGKANFTVRAIDSSVSVDVSNITYGDNEIIKFNVTDGATGTVNITVTGVDGVVATFNDVPIANGTVGVNVADLAAGNYSVNVTYSGDNNFNPSSDVANFTVNNAMPTVKVNTTDIDYNTTEPVKFNVTGVDGGALPTGNVTVVVTNSSGGVVFNGTVPVEDGLVSVPVLPAGKYNVTATYNGDANYTSVTGKANFTVRAIDSSVSVDVSNITYGDNEIIKFNVTDGATGTVNITVTGVDGVVATFNDVPIANGTVGVNVADLAAGNYSVNVTYSGDNNFNPSSDVANFTVNNAMPTVKVNTTDIDYNTTEPVKFNVTGVDGGALPTGNVTVVVTNSSGGVVFNGTVPVEDGLVSVPVLPAGKYNVTATYNGDANYTSVTGKANFTVRAIDSSVSVDVSNITYGDNEIIKFNVTDGATGTVNITVTGVDGVVATFNDVPIANGTVGVNVADLPAGNYSVNVTYGGDNNHNPSSTVANFSVSKASPSVSVNTTDIDYNTTEPVKVNVTGVDGGEVPTGNVTVIVTNDDGDVVFNDTVPITNGVVTVPVENLPAGDYNVNVTYNGDDNYANSTFTGSFKVNSINSTVTVEPVNITYGADETIKYNVTDGATGTVNITVTGPDGVTKTFNNVPIENGTVGVNVADLPAGNYTVNVTYNGDGNFNPSSAVANFSVSKATPTVNVNATDIDYHDSESIKVNVTGVDGGAVPTGNVTVVVTNASGDVVFNDTVDLSDGKMTVTVPANLLPAGDYDVNVTYNGDSNYTDASNTASFTVNKIDSTVVVNTTDITYGDTETIKVTLPEDATGTVNVTVKGPDGFEKTFTDLPVKEDGTVTVPVEDLNAGDYTVDVSYGGDNNYKPHNGTGSFSVDKSTPSVSVEGINIDYGESETITVNVTGKNITGNVTITIGGKVYGTVNLTQTEEGATAVLNIPGLSGGEHTVKAVYNGDDNHYSNQSEDQFEVSKVEPSIDVEPTDIAFGDDEIIKVNVTGVEGGSTPTGNVTVIVRNSSGDVVFKDTVDLSDGKITVSVEDLPAGDYNVTVTYNGDKNYTSIEGKNQFSVGKAKPTVSVNTTDIDYHDSESIKVNVTGAAGVTPTGNVTVVVTDETGAVVYNDTHNLTDGAVTVPVDGLVAGKYNVTVNYNGDDNYRRADDKANFTVNKIDPSILVNTSDIDYHDSETINVTVNDDATGTVSITVTNEDGDVVYSNSSELSGSKASFTIPDLSAGKYNVTVEYSGDNNYNSETAKANFTVNKIDTPVKVDTENITYGDDETINVTVNDDATGNVTITLYKNGVPVYEENLPVDEATAKFTVSELNAGNYTVQVVYSGDNNYKSNTAEGKFEVAKANATVEIHVYDIIYGDIEELTVTCNAPGNVTIYVNGVNITLPLEEGYGHTLFAALLNAYSGKAQWDLENLAVGTYPASVHYNGNENYNEADDDDVFHVLKKETSVTVSVDDIKVGEDAVINVELSPSAAPGKLTITVDGKEYHVTPKNGKASLKVPGLKAGNHTVTVSYPGSENYTDSSNETTFTVSKVKPDVDVSAPTIKVGEDGKITVTLPKDATGKVTIEIDGKNYTSQIKDGKAVFTVSGLKVGKHPIKVFYTGDDKYESSVVDGGYIKVIEENNNGSNDHKGHANGIDLSTKATGNPVLALLFVLVFLGIIPLRRKKDEEDED